MLYEYEIFRCKNTRSVKDDRRPEEETLLDIVWASDETVAVEKASAKWDIASDSLYAVQHIADTFFGTDENRPGPKIEASAYISDTDCGFELLLPDGKIIRLSFEKPENDTYRMSVSVKSEKDEKNVSEICI